MPKNDDKITLEHVKSDIRRARSNVYGASPIDQAKVMSQIAQAEATLLLLEYMQEIRNDMLVIKETTVTREEMQTEINAAVKRLTSLLLR